MQALKKLEENIPHKPYHGFAKLDIGFYEIKLYRMVKNKYGKKKSGTGKSILIELDDQVLFLPQYFNQKLTESDIQELNETTASGKPTFLYFGGKLGESK